MSKVPLPGTCFPSTPAYVLPGRRSITGRAAAAEGAPYGDVGVPSSIPPSALLLSTVLGLAVGSTAVVGDKEGDGETDGDGDDTWGEELLAPPVRA